MRTRTGATLGTRRIGSKLHGARFWQEPGRAGSGPLGAREDARDELIGLADIGVRLEPGRDHAVEVVGLALGAHAGHPSFRNGVSPSAARAARNATHRPKKARPDGTRRDAEHLRRFIEAQAEAAVQDEDRSLIGVEASEAALELVATGHIEANLHPPRNFRHPDRVDLDLDRTPPSLTPCLAITGVDDQKETSASWAASSARASSRRINRATTNR